MKTITKDPVCGMNVNPDSVLSSDRDGVRYLFCSEGCKRKFEEFVDVAPDSQAAEEPRNYLPLVVLTALTLAAACAKQAAYPGSWNWMSWMHDFMGFFLVVFSMFKFFDLQGFADGFQMYDLLAKPFRPYALLYPFLELGLGLAYLAAWNPRAVYVATIVLMGFGSLGVFNSLRKKLDIQCVCMGTVLRVPLSTVALVEDLGMVVMAAAMLATA